MAQKYLVSERTKKRVLIKINVNNVATYSEIQQKIHGIG